MYYVYILQSQKNKRLCKGFTSNLTKRITEHNSGKKYIYQERHSMESNLLSGISQKN